MSQKDHIQPTTTITIKLSDPQIRIHIMEGLGLLDPDPWNKKAEINKILTWTELRGQKSFFFKFEQLTIVLQFLVTDKKNSAHFLASFFTPCMDPDPDPNGAQCGRGTLIKHLKQISIHFQMRPGKL